MPHRGPLCPQWAQIPHFAPPRRPWGAFAGRGPALRAHRGGMYCGESLVCPVRLEMLVMVVKGVLLGRVCREWLMRSGGVKIGGCQEGEWESAPRSFMPMTRGFKNFIDVTR